MKIHWGRIVIRDADAPILLSEPSALAHTLKTSTSASSGTAHQSSIPPHAARPARSPC
jgi:hypothetical protein